MPIGRNLLTGAWSSLFCWSKSVSSHICRWGWSRHTKRWYMSYNFDRFLSDRCRYRRCSAKNILSQKALRLWVFKRIFFFTDSL